MIKKIKEEFYFNAMFLLTVLTGVILIYSTYAWFSASLNVIISDFNMTTRSTDGLFISLDGVTWSSSVSITENDILNRLTDTYPNHETQWSKELGPVSTIGIPDANNNRFKFFTHGPHRVIRPKYDNTDTLNFFEIEESGVKDDQLFVAFDVFFKNVTPSPYEDNIYIEEAVFVNADDENDDDTAVNALRLGMVFSDVTSLGATHSTIQNLGCNGRCRDFIYEPNAFNHSEKSINMASKHGVLLEHGNFYETYGMKKGGDDIMIWSGVKNDKVAINNEFYELQNNITATGQSVFAMPEGIVKARIYVWVEGQDVDIIEYTSPGYQVSVSLKFNKDHNSLN